MANDWQDLTPALCLSLPAKVRDWAALETSMTARVGKVGGCDITVDVLRQARGPLHTDERGFFDAPPAANGVVREVCLKAGAEPLLVARTVFTSRRLEDHPTIRKLGNHALGTLLFADGKPPHTARQVIQLDQSSPLWALVRQRHAPVRANYWARRTLFWLFDAPLLVTEIFLPELLNHPDARWA